MLVALQMGLTLILEFESQEQNTYFVSKLKHQKSISLIVAFLVYINQSIQFYFYQHPHLEQYNTRGKKRVQKCIKMGK